MGYHASVKEIIVSGGVTLAFLILLSIYSLALIWERWRFFQKSLSGFDHFMGQIRKALKDETLTEAVNLGRSYKGLAGGVVMASFTGPTNRDERKRAAERAIQRGATLLEKRTSILATIASTAPFIGLFGTVIGVMRAFRDLAGAAGAGPGVVAIGISEALVCTATGLFVAIPAVWAYNYFARRSASFAEEMSWLSDEILERLTERK